MKRKVPINLEYFQYLKPDSMLNAKDIKEIFGYASTHSVDYLVKRGLFPKHDAVNPKMKTSVDEFFWKRDTVLKALHELNSKILNPVEG